MPLKSLFNIKTGLFPPAVTHQTFFRPWAIFTSFQYFPHFLLFYRSSYSFINNLLIIMKTHGCKFWTWKLSPGSEKWGQRRRDWAGESCFKKFLFCPVSTFTEPFGLDLRCCMCSWFISSVLNSALLPPFDERSANPSAAPSAFRWFLVVSPAPPSYCWCQTQKHFADSLMWQEHSCECSWQSYE